MLLEEQYTTIDVDSQQADEQAPADVVDNHNNDNEGQTDANDSSESGQDNHGNDDQQQLKKGRDLNDRFRYYSKSLKEKDAHIRALTARLSALESNTQPSAPEPEDVPPNPEDARFKTVDEYVSALANYQAKKAFKEIEAKRKAQEVEERTRHEMAQLHEDWGRKLAQAQKELPDWQSVVEDAEIPASPDVGEEILKSDVGPKIAYYLAKNPDVLLGLNKLPKDRVIKEIAKLEVNLSMKQSSPMARKPAPPADLRNSKPAGKIDKSSLPMSEFYKLKMQGKI